MLPQVTDCKRKLDEYKLANQQMIDYVKSIDSQMCHKVNKVTFMEQELDFEKKFKELHDEFPARDARL